MVQVLKTREFQAHLRQFKEVCHEWYGERKESTPALQRWVCLCSKHTVCVYWSAVGQVRFRQSLKAQEALGASPQMSFALISDNLPPFSQSTPYL